MKRTLAFILTMVMVLSMATFSYAADVERNLVAHWTFDQIVDTDGVLTVEDVTGNGNTLTINDPLYAQVTGFTGSAIDFQTADKVNSTVGAYNGAMHSTADITKMNSYLNGVDGMTVSMWIKREGYGLSANYSFFSFSPNGAALKLSAERYGIKAETRSASNGQAVSSNYFYPINSSTECWPQLAANTADVTERISWQHVTVVSDFKNQKLRFYMDGHLVDEVTPANWNTEKSSYSIHETAGYMGIGESHSLVDDVKIYNRALTQDEIRANIPAVIEYNYESMTGTTTPNANTIPAVITLPSTAELVDGAVGNTIHMGGKATFPYLTFRNPLLMAKQTSFSTWMKLVDGNLPTVNQQAIIGEGRGGIHIMLLKSGKIQVGGRSQHTDGAAVAVSTSAVFTAGDTSWHHIAGILDHVNKTVTLYVDGELNNTVDYSTNTNATWFSTPYYFVKAHTSTQIDYFDLKNDADVLTDSTKIYRRALTASEVAAEYKLVYKDFVSAEFEATGDSVIATCDFFNNTGADIAADTYMVFLGMYDGDELVKISALKVPAIGNLQSLDDQTVTISEIEEPEIYTYKLFVWNGTTLEPYYTTDYEITF